MLRDLLLEAYGAMRHNRRRTTLTMLGMAWGIATVVMLLSYGNGFGQACANIFANFGTKLMIMVPGRSSMQAGGQKAGAPIRFTLDDVDTLTTNIPQITHITLEASKQANIQYETRTFPFNVTGNYPTCFPSARSSWRWAASTTRKMRYSTPAWPSLAPRPKKNFSLDGTHWANEFASMALAWKSSES